MKIAIAVTMIDGENDGEVALQDGVDHQLADAGEAEDRLDDDRAVEHAPPPGRRSR